MSARQSAKKQYAKKSRDMLFENLIPVGNAAEWYLNPKGADVSFVFNADNGCVKHVPAHKILLAMASDVFEAMFFGQLAETGDVAVTDATAAGFEEFLQFFYRSWMRLTRENVAEVLHLGQKYNVAKCVESCVQFLKGKLTEHQICTGLNLAILYHQLELQKFCEKVIVVKTSAVFKSADFLTCEKRVLGHILGMNLLSCSETEVFEACMSWVKARSKQDVLSKDLVEAHLGDLFYEIRFKSMTMQQFATLAASYDSVLSTDFKDIANLIVLPNFQPETFNKTPRQAEWNGDAVIKCSRAMNEEEWTVIFHNKEKSTFSSNEPVLLGGFVCNRMDATGRMSFEVQITEASALGRKNGNTISNVKVTASLESKGIKILLPLPVLIRPGFFYNIFLSQTAEAHYHHVKAKVNNELTAARFISALMFNRI